MWFHKVVIIHLTFSSDFIYVKLIIYLLMVNTFILIPYRNRDKHLTYFLNHTVLLLQKHIPRLKVIVIEQTQGALFNRGKLLNVGFDFCRTMNEDVVLDTDVFFTHDVDINPYESTIVSLYTMEMLDNHINGIYTSSCNTLGGIIQFNANTFQRINGFPNSIWGWGAEDKALQNRAEFYEIKVKKNILNNNPNRETYFHIFDDIQDRNVENHNKFNHNKQYIQFRLMRDKEKRETIQNDGLSTLNYTVLKKETIIHNVLKITVEIGKPSSSSSSS